MAANNLGSAWSSMKTIADPRSPNNSSQVTLDGLSSVIEPHITYFLLTCFYNRFNTLDFSHEIQELSFKLVDNQHLDKDKKTW